MKKAQDSKERNEVWEIWLVLYQSMTEETFIGFDEFYSNLKEKNKVDNSEPLDIQGTFEHYKGMVKEFGN